MSTKKKIHHHHHKTTTTTAKIHLEDPLQSEKSAKVSENHNHVVNGKNLAHLLELEETDPKAYDKAVKLMHEKNITFTDESMHKESEIVGAQYESAREKKIKRVDEELEKVAPHRKKRKKEKNDEFEEESTSDSDSDEERKKQDYLKVAKKNQEKQAKTDRRKVSLKETHRKMREDNLVDTHDFTGTTKMTLSAEEARKKYDTPKQYEDPLKIQQHSLEIVDLPDTKKMSEEERLALPAPAIKLYELQPSEQALLNQVGQLQVGATPLNLSQLANLMNNVNFGERDMNFFVTSLMGNGVVKSRVPQHRVEDVDKAITNLTCVSRKRETRYLRQRLPDSDEQNCLKDQECEGMRMPKGFQPCILVEFLTDRERLERESGANNKRHMCVMCRRFLAQYIISAARSSSATSDTSFTFSYCNLPDLPEEYSSADCIRSTSNQHQIVMGSVANHVPSKYEQKWDEKRRIFYYLQTGFLEVRPPNKLDHPYFQ